LKPVTGETSDVTELNRKLACAARTCDIPMAVGSQAAAIQDSSVRESFSVVRKENPDGIIIANVGANTCPDAVFLAVDMIKADALQIHLNVAQELTMPEGDRNFQGYTKNIKHITQALAIPVIVKEVGFGMAREQIAELSNLGVTAIDIGGCGGTNFAMIETARGSKQASGFLNAWGISTACSIIEALAGSKTNVDIIASGGVRTAEDIIKALALGSKAAGIAAPCLQILINEGLEALTSFIQRLQYELRCIMLLTGAANIKSLQTKPVVIIGNTGQWLQLRGIDLTQFAQRPNK